FFSVQAGQVSHCAQHIHFAAADRGNRARAAGISDRVFARVFVLPELFAILCVETNDALLALQDAALVLVGDRSAIDEIIADVDFSGDDGRTGVTGMHWLAPQNFRSAIGKLFEQPALFPCSVATWPLPLRPVFRANCGQENESKPEGNE